MSWLQGDFCAVCPVISKDCLYGLSCVESAVVSPGVKDESLCEGSRLELVFSLLPADPRLPVGCELYAHITYRKRLYGIWYSVSVTQVLEHSLVYGPADSKSECRVEAIFHVREVLMRKKLEEHRRGRRGP